MSKPTCQTCGNKVDTSLREVPEACIRLTEDVVALDLALKFLRSVDVGNVGDDKDENDLHLGAVKVRLLAMHRYARRKLAAGYLCA